VRPRKSGPKIVAIFLSATLACSAFAQQPPAPDTQTKQKTRVCAIEDETKVTSPDNPNTSQVLVPGYCVECWAGLGCGEPFLATGLLGLLGGSAGAAGGAAAVGAAALGGVLGGLYATGAIGGGGGNGNPRPPGGGGGGPPFQPPGPPPVIPPPHPLPTPPAVSPFH